MIPLSASASRTVAAAQFDINLPRTLDRVDREFRENDDVSDELLPTLLNDASTSSQQLPLSARPTFLPLCCRVLSAGALWAAWCPDLTAALSFCSQCLLSSSSLATKVYEWRAFTCDDTQNVLLPEIQTNNCSIKSETSQHLQYKREHKQTRYVMYKPNICGLMQHSTRNLAIARIANRTGCQWPSRSSKVDNFRFIWKGICHFLLVINIPMPYLALFSHNSA